MSEFVFIPQTTDPLAGAKAQRAAQVAAIKVTTQSGKTFDGDEVSQDRMVRAIVGLQAIGQTQTLWVLANNVPTEVSVTELIEALGLAGAAQAAVWAKPYGA